MPNKFKLQIYTWPAGRGIDYGPGAFPEFYAWTPKQAVSILDAYTQPYAYAVLSKASPGGYYPCDWAGRDVGSGEWPHRQGTNGEHPAYLAVMADWDALKAEVLRGHRTDEGERIGTMAIAAQILKERHPLAILAHRLGAEAIGANPERI